MAPAVEMSQRISCIDRDKAAAATHIISDMLYVVSQYYDAWRLTLASGN